MKKRRGFYIFRVLAEMMEAGALTYMEWVVLAVEYSDMMGLPITSTNYTAPYYEEKP